MTRILSTLAAATMAILALTWPLQALAFIPGINLYAPAVLAVVSGVLVALHAVTQGRLRIPFELAVPWLAIIVLALVTHSWIVLAAAFAFALPVQFRASREHVLVLFKLTAVAATAAAALTLIAWFQHWMPTAYILETGASLYFAHSVPGGVIILITGMVAALGLTLAPRTPMLFRVFWAAAAILQGAAASTAAVGLLVTFATPSAPRIATHGPLTILLALVLLYGAARVAAKVFVDAEERPTIIHVLFLLMLAIAAAGEILAPAAPIGFAFLAGIASAYALPADAATPSRAQGPVAVVLAGVLLSLNVIHVFPGSTRDGRNYDVAAAKDLAAGHTGTLHRRLDLIERLSPAESKTHWWRAQALLTENRPMRAVTEFAASLAAAPNTLLPPPNGDERDDFLRELRDAESAAESPHQHYAYARALVANGNPSEALAATRLHAERHVIDAPPVDTAPLAEAVAFLLGDRALADDAAAWPPGMLLATLKNWGATLTEAPEWFPPEHLPAVFAGQYLPASTATLVAFPGDIDYQEQPFDVSPAPTEDPPSYWTPIFGDEKKWVIEWIAPSQGRGPARITGRAATWDLLTYETTLTAIPETSAVTVWLPPSAVAE